MVKPSIEQLTKGKYNRYILVIATAKSARFITDKQNREKDVEQVVPDRFKFDVEKSAKKYMDEKPVKIAINMLNDGEFKISDSTLTRALDAGLERPEE
jgi:DNA-directed RNA polymerase, omega subunit